MFSKVKIEFHKINGSENDFLENLHDHGIIICFEIEGRNENILIIWDTISCNG